MKSANIILWYRNKFPESYKNISRHLDKTEGAEEKARIYVAANTLFCFSVGLAYDTIEYACSGIPLLLGANLASLVIYAIVARLYIFGKVSVSTALVTLFFTVQANVSVTIFHNYTVLAEQGGFIISHDLFLGFLVCILAAVSVSKNKVHVLCALPLAAPCSGPCH